ncbi:MAG: hypothetical protein Q8Q14_00520 [Gemmatimonadales bacterium]|nr:hypothetical protein [Gemmatimonadales bacterium]
MTTHVRALAVAAESSFGSIAAATGLPDVAALVFRQAEFELASVDLSSLEAETTENADGRDGFYHRPPEPVTVWSGGSRVRRLTGTIKVKASLRTAGVHGGTFSYYGQVPLAQMIASGMGVHNPAALLVTATGASSATRFTVGVADFAAAVVGDMLATEIAGRAEFSAITGKSAPATLIHSPALSAGLVLDDEARLCRVFHLTTDEALFGPSIALIIDGDGWRAVAVGCRMESLAISYDGRKVVCEVTLRAAHADTDHASADVSPPTYEAGAIVHALGSYAVISGAATGAAPWELARNVVGVDEFSASITNTLAPLSRSDSILGMSDYRIAKQDAEVSLTLSRAWDTVDDDLLDQTERSVLVGWGPPGKGDGACLYLPAAHLTNDAALRDLGGDVVRQSLNYRQGRNAGDNSNAEPAGTHARLAFAL